jgi:hypothetical protein
VRADNREVVGSNPTGPTSRQIIASRKKHRLPSGPRKRRPHGLAEVVVECGEPFGHHFLTDPIQGTAAAAECPAHPSDRRSGSVRLRRPAQGDSVPRLLLHGRGQGGVSDRLRRPSPVRRDVRTHPLGVAPRTGRRGGRAGAVREKNRAPRQIGAAIAVGQRSSFATCLVWHRPDLSGLAVCRLEAWIEGQKRGPGLGSRAFAEIFRDLPR